MQEDQLPLILRCSALRNLGPEQEVHVVDRGDTSDRHFSPLRNLLYIRMLALHTYNQTEESDKPGHISVFLYRPCPPSIRGFQRNTVKGRMQI